MTRQQQWERVQEETDFDVAILGGGVNGACLYDTLCRHRYKVLLIERGDFASGSSQSSGMMVWGGLLYLKNFDFSTVFQLSHDRDRMIAQKAGWMKPTMMRLISSAKDRRAAWWLYSGLWFYWLMGLGRRHRPYIEAAFPEMAMLRPGVVQKSLCYEEAFLNESDARFVFRWIAAQRAPGQITLNYCNAQGSYAAKEKRWYLELTDALSGSTHKIRAVMVVNCAGVWTDRVNAEFGIDSPFRHVLSKGVYLGLPRSGEHHSSLFFELNDQDDVITHVPWGPIALWGPTETPVQSIEEGFSTTREDIDFLLEQYALRYREPIGIGDVVSVRCGIRPLVVDKSYTLDCYPLDLSRRQEIVQHHDKPWISCYGGKLTGCMHMAEMALQRIKRSVAPTGEAGNGVPDGEMHVRQTRFPCIDQPVVSPAWSVEHEQCCTLEDYLRRRTNIAQWTACGGLGKNDAYARTLRDIALEIAGGEAQRAARLFDDYRKKMMNSLSPLFTESKLPETVSRHIQ